MGSIKGSSRSAGLHARNPWTCVCGRTVYGNGGKSSHQRACRPWAEKLIERNQEAITKIDNGTYSKRTSEATLQKLAVPV